jgi:4,5-DOPA dioxygenase extradiol
LATGAVSLTTLSAFINFIENLKQEQQLMSVFFIGHGSPMNGIEDTEFSRRWTQTAKEIPVPKTVLVISEHWFTKGTIITAMDLLKTMNSVKLG